MATANLLYSDSLVEITEDTLCFKDYYFPVGSKCLRFADIENITAEAPNWLNGQFRIQGTSDLRTWFPRDWHRPSRTTIFTANLRGSSRRVGFTVENANRAEKIFLEKSLLKGDQMPYPNDDYWKALADGAEIQVNWKPYLLSVVDCGDLVMPTGLLAVCDPFTTMQVSGNSAVQLPPGRYPVKVTLADVSGLRNGSQLREAYASLVLSEEPEVMRRQMPLLNTTDNAFGVDSTVACFVDEGALAEAMPPKEKWDDIFEDDSEASWINRIDDPAEIRDGLANIVLPQAQHGENIILIHSKWGDGTYGVVGSYDRQDNLTAVHIDFKVVWGPEKR